MKRMKKCLCLLVAAAMLLALLPAFASAAVIASGNCGAQGDNVTWTLTDDGVLTISGTGAMTDYTGDPAPWYDFRGLITTAVVSPGVTSIGRAAFESCGNLTSVTIPDSVTEIGTYAFADCSSLASVTIPDGVTEIGAATFYGCSSLASVTIPDGVTEIGEGTFYGCSSLTSVTIPDSVTSIVKDAFYECNALTEVNYAGTQAQWNAIAFGLGNSPLLVVKPVTGGVCGDGLTWTLENGTLTISGTGAMADFDDYSGPWYSFRGLITTAVVSPGVTRIGKNAFESCGNLTSVTVPKSVTSIGSWAFYKCSSLEDVYYSGTEEEWNKFTFGSSNSILTNGSVTMHYAIGGGTCGAQGDNLTWTLYNDGLLTISGTGEMKNYSASGDNAAPWGTAVTSVIIDSGVTSIGNYAFYHCASLTAAAIADSVTAIGTSAFNGCEALNMILLPQTDIRFGINAFNNTAWFNAQPDGLVYIGNEAYKYKGEMPADTKIAVKEGTKRLTPGVFNNCSNLVEITFPASLEEIGNNTFFACTGLKEVLVPDGIKRIGVGAFRNCSGVQMVSIPASLETIEMIAFNGCTSLTDVYYRGTEEQKNATLKIDANNIPVFNATWHYAEPLAAGNVTLSWSSKPYNGSVQRPAVTVKNAAGTVLAANTDYTLTWSNANSKDKGSYTVTVAGKGNYTGGGTATYAITAQTLAAANVTLSWSSKGYNGSVQKPAVTVKNAAGTVLAANTDYTLTWSNANSKDKGSYTVTVAGKGNYSGSGSKTYSITEHDPHTWNAGTVTKAATCKETGTKLYTCTLAGCGATKTETIAKNASNHVGGTEVRDAKAATCKDTGYTGDTYCKGCGVKIKTGTATAKSTTHTWDSGKVTKAATCKETGVKTYTCTVCKTTKTETIAKNAGNHAGGTEVKNAKTATCKDTGYTGDTYCKGCGAKIKTGTATAKSTTHTWDSGKVTKAAACNATGVKTFTCSVCKTTKTETIAKNAANHAGGTEVKNAKTATCAAAGYTGDTYCKGCGAKLKTGSAIAKTTDHKWDAGKVTKAATCNATGVKTFTCSVCKTTKTETIAKDASNHAGGTEVKNARAATCKEAGYTGDTYCKGCGAKLKTGSAIAKTNDHKWDAGKVTKEATATADGVKTYTCTVCGATKTESIPKLADHTHTWDEGKVTKEATCKEDGVKTYTCTVCKTTKTESIPKKTDHTYDAGKVTKEPTCKESGVKTYTCASCGATKTESLPKTADHKWDGGKVTKEATAAAEGVKTYTCTVCGATRTESIPKLANHTHTWDEGKVTKEPTCKEDGVKTFTCTSCGETKTETLVKTADHKWDDGKVTKEATATAEGVMTYTCSVCGETKTESIPKKEPTAQDDFLLGDVDGNGKVESADARLALRASVKLENYAEGSREFRAADVNKNSKIGSDDARTILRVSVKLESFA